ncbi:L,D-transpeptidase family protein [Chelativorans sp. ZYF759]|nr:L,D-transpeptidase family protein [Chelativorans sp. ZYF759]
MLAGIAASLTGCMSPASRPDPVTVPGAMRPDPHLARMYAAMPQERFPIPAVDVTQVDPRYLRQEVSDPTGEEPGTIVVDTSEKFLYLVREGGRALRYGVGVGREGLSWSGRALIQMKREWPRWTPTENMIGRDPSLARFAGGMEPGLQNPLGARALYLFENGRDTLYRLHGTNEPWSIGRAMSSGCIRLFNQDIIDLYERTPTGTRVFVLDHRSATASAPSVGEVV